MNQTTLTLLIDGLKIAVVLGCTMGAVAYADED